MMRFESCILYGISDIRRLQEILGFKLFEYHDNNKIYSDSYCVRIVNDGNRLIEEPKRKLKKIQKRICALLSELELPEYFFSCKGKNIIECVAVHSNKSRQIIKVDISKFFPNTTRDKVYKFWKNSMQMPSRVAELMTNLTTVTTAPSGEIADFYRSKAILYNNHLPTGSPTSSLLSFLVNHDMFEAIYEKVKEHNGKMTLYADDLTVSNCKKPYHLFTEINGILYRNGYRIALKKSGIKQNNRSVIINGLIVTRNGELRLPNRLHSRIKELKSTEDSNKQQLDGLLNYKNQVERLVCQHITQRPMSNSTLYAESLLQSE